MPTYTPYDGTSKPFAIGLSPLDPDRWIEPDDDLPVYLEEKERLARAHLENIFREAPESRAAQQECLDLLLGHLVERHGGRYQLDGGRVAIGNRVVDIAGEDLPALFRAGSLIQDDLVILMPKPEGWTITAAHLAFPSSWSLAEKFMRPMDEVHAQVPGYQAGTRNATIINRIFDSLLPEQPVERFNWSVNWRYALYHPRSVRPSTDPFSSGIDTANAFIRVERQTLRKLPSTGAIVFTIRIYLDPVKAIAAGPGGAERAKLLAGQLEGMTTEQADYKGLKEKREELVKTLRALAG